VAPLRDAPELPDPVLADHYAPMLPIYQAARDIAPPLWHQFTDFTETRHG
jgi:hypothetical protein